MAVILALETTTDICSVTIGTLTENIEDTRRIPRQHNAQVLQMVDDVCTASAFCKSDIACVAFSAGPGSFTGVRISASIAQGIAYALNAQVYAVPTALALVERAQCTFELPSRLEVVRRSRRNFVYVARVCTDDSAERVVRDEQLLDEHAFESSEYRITDTDFASSSMDVLAIAARSCEQWSNPSDALPLYVQGDHPWGPK